PMVRHYAWRRSVRGWPRRALQTDAGLVAAIAANPPHEGSPPPGEAEQERRLADIIGADAEARRRDYENVTDADPGRPHFFIGMVGVRPESRGEGYAALLDRKSTRLNSSHVKISYAVFCLKKKKE